MLEPETKTWVEQLDTRDGTNADPNRCLSLSANVVVEGRIRVKTCPVVLLDTAAPRGLG